MRPNCEKHPTRAKTYIVYDKTGFAFRAQRDGANGRWIARPSHMGAQSDHRYFSAAKLDDLCDIVGTSKKD
jgi:hypothetical protein